MGETTNIFIISSVTGLILILIILLVATYCKNKKARKNLVYTRVTFESDSEDYDQDEYSKDSLLYNFTPNHEATIIE